MADPRIPSKPIVTLVDGNLVRVDFSGAPVAPTKTSDGDATDVGSRSGSAFSAQGRTTSGALPSLPTSRAFGGSGVVVRRTLPLTPPSDATISKKPPPRLPRCFDETSASALLAKLASGDTSMETLELAAVFISRIANAPIFKAALPISGDVSPWELEENKNQKIIPLVAKYFFGVDWPSRICPLDVPERENPARICWQDSIKFALQLWPFSYPVTNPDHLAVLSDNTFNLVLKAAWRSLTSDRTVLKEQARLGKLTAFERDSLKNCRAVILGFAERLRFLRFERPFTPEESSIALWFYIPDADKAMDELVEISGTAGS